MLFAAHTRDTDDWESHLGTEVFNSGFQDHGFLGRFEHQAGPGTFSAAWQSDFGRDIERPRNNSQTVRFYYPTENSHRFTTGYEANNVMGFQQVSFTGFMGTFDQRTDQDRFATATTGRTIERADISAKDFHVRGAGSRLLGKARLEVGVDVNGRYGLHAVDDLFTYNLAGSLVSDRPNVSVDTARRTDTGVFASVDGSVASMFSIGAGVRGDYVTTSNQGGYFGDRSTGNGAGSGYLSATLGSSAGFSLTGQVARGFRDPVLSDRYYRGPTGRGFITGNPDLNPETSLQYDVAARYTAPAFRLAAFYYHYDIEDLIERYSTATDFFFFRNRGEARIRGLRGRRPGHVPRRGHAGSLGAGRGGQGARQRRRTSTTCRRPTSPRPCASSSATALSDRSVAPTSRTTIISGRRNAPSPDTLSSTSPRDSGWRGRSSCECLAVTCSTRSCSRARTSEPSWRQAVRCR